MLETPESFKYGFQRNNFEDWAISRQLLIRNAVLQTAFCQQDASVPFPESPQRLYAARPNLEKDG